MKFTLLLFALGVKLRMNALVSKDFRKKLRKENFALVIRTAGNERARTFRFRKGWFRSRPGSGPRVDTELVWCDPDTAVRTMLSKNELDVFSAIGRSELRILGNFKYALWFMELAG
jgi:hypothetical protein